MIRRFLISGLALAALPWALSGVSGNAAEPRPEQPAPRLLNKANILPLALDDAFEFRKQKIFVQDRKLQEQTSERMIRFERERTNWGAVTAEERREREGHYFTFWWRSTRPANVTVRLEYRQGNLGNYVQAQEVDFSVGKGTHKAKFDVIGDCYHDDGPVIAWRAVVVENGKIVALTQSHLWH